MLFPESGMRIGRVAAYAVNLGTGINELTYESRNVHASLVHPGVSSFG